MARPRRHRARGLVTVHKGEPMFLKKDRAGSDSHGHHWPHDGAIIEVADHLVHDLLAIRDAGFRIIEHHQPTAAPADSDVTQPPGADAQPTGPQAPSDAVDDDPGTAPEPGPVDEPAPPTQAPVTEPAPPTHQAVTETTDKPRRGGRPRKAPAPAAETVAQPEV